MSTFLPAKVSPFLVFLLSLLEIFWRAHVEVMVRLVCVVAVVQLPKPEGQKVISPRVNYLQFLHSTFERYILAFQR